MLKECLSLQPAVPFTSAIMNHASKKAQAGEQREAARRARLLFPVFRRRERGSSTPLLTTATRSRCHPACAFPQLRRAST